MPIYEYRCENCGEQVEILVLSQKAALPECPQCGSTRLARLLSAPYIISGQSHPQGHTCCGREERCASPPCSEDQACRRER